MSTLSFGVQVALPDRAVRQTDVAETDGKLALGSQRKRGGDARQPGGAVGKAYQRHGERPPIAPPAMPQPVSAACDVGEQRTPTRTIPVAGCSIRKRACTTSPRRAAARRS